MPLVVMIFDRLPEDKSTRGRRLNPMKQNHEHKFLYPLADGLYSEVPQHKGQKPVCAICRNQQMVENLHQQFLEKAANQGQGE
jgi:hypothetical protein